ncbi:MAG: cysteine desulfurase [Bernardetiaceae bacterium]|nr:cysteine desulfurase [Bernardetiaceae bacterium]
MNIKNIRADFPILAQSIQERPLIYFDNAATSQKPQVVIDAITHYYTHLNSNVHRGAHTLAERATIAFERTRETARAFINAASVQEVIFVKGTTEGINLVAQSFGTHSIEQGDEILISEMEHHSNIVPWQILAERKGAILKVIPVSDEGELDMEAFDKLLTEKCKMLAIVHVSNALGTHNPVKQMIQKAHAVGAKVLVDGAQSSPHFEIDVQDLDCDFYTFSAHKVYGPTGIGILYGKKEILDELPPYMGGGEMIKEVTFAKTSYNELPYKFEAGTPNIGDAVAFHHAMEYVNQIGKKNIATHEEELLRYGTEKLSNIEGLTIIGRAKEKASVISFIVKGVHHYDIGMLLDSKGIAVRTGHHCTQPLMSRFGIDGTVRASFAVYNEKEEIDMFAKELAQTIDMLR